MTTLPVVRCSQCRRQRGTICSICSRYTRCILFDVLALAYCEVPVRVPALFTEHATKVKGRVVGVQLIILRHASLRDASVVRNALPEFVPEAALHLHFCGTRLASNHLCRGTDLSHGLARSCAERQREVLVVAFGIGAFI